MSEEKLAPQGGSLSLRGRFGSRPDERNAILAGHEQGRLVASIVEQPAARRVQAIGARDAQDVLVRGYLFVCRIVEEGEARVVVEGQNGTSDLSAPRLRAMVHVGKVTAYPRESAD